MSDSAENTVSVPFSRALLPVGTVLCIRHVERNLYSIGVEVVYGTDRRIPRTTAERTHNLFPGMASEISFIAGQQLDIIREILDFH